MSRRTAPVNVVVVLLALTALASAQPVDLRLRHAPVPGVGSLVMRDEVMAAEELAASASASTSTSADIDVRVYEPVPTQWRDVQERVIFKLNIGYGLDSGAASGDFGKTGVVPTDVTDSGGNAFIESRQYLLGDAVLGSRGVLLPSMNTYFQSQFRIDSHGASAFAAMNNVYDTRDGRALLVRAGYAEIDDYGEQGTALNKLFVRAGRQYRYGATRFITNFDGVTAGYDEVGYEVSGFVGQRVSLFFDDDKGIVGGVGIKARGKQLANLPMDVALDYLAFDSEAGTSSFLELNSRFHALGVKYNAFARFADTGDGLGFARIGFDGRVANKNTYLTARWELIGEAETAYDFVSPVSGDVINVANEVRLGLEQPFGAMRVGATVLHLVARDIEVYGFGRLNRVDGSHSAFDTSYLEGGGAVRAALGRNTRVGGQYKLRVRSLDEDAQQAGSQFDDTAGAGVSSFQELSGEARYSLGDKNAATVGAYLRVYDIETPYAEVTTDARAGARLAADYWLHKQARVKLAGEIAQPSPTFAAEIGTMTSVRLLLEAVF